MAFFGPGQQDTGGQYLQSVGGLSSQTQDTVYPMHMFDGLFSGVSGTLAFINLFFVSSGGGGGSGASSTFVSG